MNLMNSFMALSLLILMSFSLLKTIELSGCRHEMVSEGFWLTSEMLLSSDEKSYGASCGQTLLVEKDDSGFSASQPSGDYHFQVSTNMNSEELK